MPGELSFRTYADMHIRRLGVEDADQLKAMRVEATKESPASVYPTPEEELEKSIDEFRRKLGWDLYNYISGAFDDGNLVGIAGLRRERGQKIHHTAILWGLYVTPQYRARGIAKNLVKAILDMAGGIGAVTQIKLCVHTRNVAARRVYTASGFRSYGIERNAIRIGEESFDEELMMLTLR